MQWEKHNSKFFFFKSRRNWFHVSPSKNNVEAAQMQVAEIAENDPPNWTGHILYLEQGVRTWIIKLSCELITPLQKARTFPRSQEEIKKDDSDFKFFANEINFFS